MAQKEKTKKRKKSFVAGEFLPLCGTSAQFELEAVDELIWVNCPFNEEEEETVRINEKEFH